MEQVAGISCGGFLRQYVQEAIGDWIFDVDIYSYASRPLHHKLQITR